MNIDLNKSSPELDTLSNWLLNQGLMQLVKSNTRHRTVNYEGEIRLETSLMDHIYSNNDLVIKTIETGYSDHEAIVVTMNINQNNGPKIKHKVRDRRKYNIESLQEHFEYLEFENLNITERYHLS